jgi:phosphoribosyl-AMP cyclohydrolase
MRRKAFEKRYLVELSHKNQELFEAQWDLRLESWLIEVRKRSHRWEHGETTHGLVFEILDNAMDILAECDKAAAAKVVRHTYDELCHGCATSVAHVIDDRLCRFSNTSSWPKYGRKGKAC